MIIDMPKIKHGQMTAKDLASAVVDIAEQRNNLEVPPWGVYPNKETWQLALRKWCGDPELTARLDEIAESRCVFSCKVKSDENE